MSCSSLGATVPWRCALSSKMACDGQISVKWPAGAGPRTSRTAVPGWLSDTEPRCRWQGQPSGGYYGQDSLVESEGWACVDDTVHGSFYPSSGL